MSQNLAPTPQKRLEYLDCLRVAATFAVIFDHVANQKWYAGPEMTGWTIIHIYESLAHWAVPIFVMISGALFLPRTIRIRTLYTKYIARIVCAFLFWTLVYGVIEYGKGYSLDIIISHLFTGQLHMWYLFMIVGLYACVPLLKPIAESERLTKYYLALAAVFAFGNYQLLALMQDLNVPGMQTFQTIIYYFGLYFVGGYTSYFLLGNLLEKHRFTKRQRRLCYFIGLDGLLATTILSLAMSYYLGAANNRFFDNMTLNVFMTAIGIFVWARFHCDNLPAKVRQAAAWLSPYCFGIYLIHPIIIGFLETKNINALTWSPWLGTPVVSVLVFAVALGATWIIRKLPVLGKQIV